jgi:hypothetical protein
MFAKSQEVVFLDLALVQLTLGDVGLGQAAAPVLS